MQERGAVEIYPLSIRIPAAESLMASAVRFSSSASILFFFFSLLSGGRHVHGHPNYGDALAKAILFFHGQRSGKLTPDQKIAWRSDSALADGSAANVDLTGGYYDAGDNVKFNFPMAFTTTMLSWSVIEYGKRMGEQVGSARVAVRWGADYLLKAATATPGTLYVGVGDANADHKCWERPEDMDTPRTVYAVTAAHPGSDVAAETAAALAAASLVFRTVDKAYAARLLAAARLVMDFAMKYQGKYSDFLGSSVCPFYCSYSGYKDELLWGASWLYRATNNASYLRYLQSLGANDDADIFSWDNKYAGARVLLSRPVVVGGLKSLDPFRVQAETFMCRILPNSPSCSTQYTAGGLMYKMTQANLQYVTSISFLLSTYAKYMATSNHTFSCGSLLVTPKALRSLAKKQLDYILGENPQKMSYMVGYGSRYPQRIHHRGSSLPSLVGHRQRIGCQEGFGHYSSGDPNPNVLTGAVVGGPDKYDRYADDRTDYGQSEPATYINAPLVGSLAYLGGSYGS